METQRGCCIGYDETAGDQIDSSECRDRRRRSTDQLIDDRADCLQSDIAAGLDVIQLEHAARAEGHGVAGVHRYVARRFDIDVVDELERDALDLRAVGDKLAIAQRDRSIAGVEVRRDRLPALGIRVVLVRQLERAGASEEAIETVGRLGRLRQHDVAGGERHGGCLTAAGEVRRDLLPEPGVREILRSQRDAATGSDVSIERMAHAEEIVHRDLTEELLVGSGQAVEASRQV